VQVPAGENRADRILITREKADVDVSVRPAIKLADEGIDRVAPRDPPPRGTSFEELADSGRRERVPNAESVVGHRMSG
jgi:hypothetical protein